eukprot:6271276-Prymnesium_polylepis.1
MPQDPKKCHVKNVCHSQIVRGKSYHRRMNLEPRQCTRDHFMCMHMCAYRIESETGSPQCCGISVRTPEYYGLWPMVAAP